MEQFKARSVRPPAVAGRFYPHSASELRAVVGDLLAAANSPTGATTPKGLIAPHAGYIYSGPIAASAYVHWRADARQIKRVVLLGPAHFVAVEGLVASSCSAFATPLGEVPVDLSAIEALLAAGEARVCDEAHVREHSLEVQLPFLQVLLGEFGVVPLLVGDATEQQVSRALERLWDGVETRFVISSDLSHYLHSDAARSLDRETARAIEELKPQHLGEHQACGRIPIRGLLTAAASHGLKATTVDLRNSGDTAGPREQVVGYGAFVFGL